MMKGKIMARKQDKDSIESLFKDTEKQLDILRRETQKRLDEMLGALVEGNLDGLRKEIRKTIDSAQRRQLERNVDALERGLANLAGFGGATSKATGQVIENLSLNQYAVSLQQLLQRALRNI
jgi:hypothetical protein